MPDDRSRTFDEKAALAELERLREEREAAGLAHKRKAEEFDRLIESVRTQASPVRRAQPSPASSTPVVERGAPVTPSEPESLPEPSLAAGPPAPSVAPLRDGRSPHRWRYGRLLALGAAAAVVIALAVPCGRPRISEPEPPTVSPPSAAAESATATAQAPTPTPAPAPPAPVVPAGVRIELRTAAAVWVRVVVDGDTRMERVVAGGEHLSFAGHRSVVVRAGNAGDLFVTTSGREVPFGVAGHPLTRTFVPSPAGPPSERP